MVKSLVMSSGHGKKVSGAVGILNEVNEARKVVNKVSEYLKQLGVKVYTFHDDTSTTANKNLQTIVKYHNGKSRELDVSIHFNALKKTDSPRGTEVFYYDQKALAVKVSKAIASAGGLKDRGGKENRGLYFLKNTSKPAILIEVCFVDSKADADLYKKNFDKICRAIAESLAGKKLPAPKPPQKPSKPSSSSKISYQVIAGSFSQKTNADQRVKELKSKGFEAYVKEVN